MPPINTSKAIVRFDQEGRKGPIGRLGDAYGKIILPQDPWPAHMPALIVGMEFFGEVREFDNFCFFWPERQVVTIRSLCRLPSVSNGDLVEIPETWRVTLASDPSKLIKALIIEATLGVVYYIDYIQANLDLATELTIHLQDSTKPVIYYDREYWKYPKSYQQKRTDWERPWNREKSAREREVRLEKLRSTKADLLASIAQNVDYFTQYRSELEVMAASDRIGDGIILRMIRENLKRGRSLSPNRAREIRDSVTQEDLGYVKTRDGKWVRDQLEVS